MNADCDFQPFHADFSVIDDIELLRRYVQLSSESAFAELVRRRIGLVYSVALRYTCGNSQSAEDATQAVFVDLARKAPVLVKHPVLAGWLYRSARFAAAGLMRTDQRRQKHEQEANNMNKIIAQGQPEPEWHNARPLIDEVLSEMDTRDRDAIVLRYFDGRPFAEIGTKLRVTENGARMRVERGLDKLNATLRTRGIDSTRAALVVALGQQVGAAVPAGLAASVTSAALGQAAVASSWLATIFSVSKLQWGLVGAVAVAGAASYSMQTRANSGLRRQIAELHASSNAAMALRAENRRLAAEIEGLRRDDAELNQLAQIVAELQRANVERARAAQAANREQEARAEIDRLNREGNKLVEEFKVLKARASEPALMADVRAQADHEAKLILAAIQTKKTQIQVLAASSGVTPLQSQVRPAFPPLPDEQFPATEYWTPVDERRVSLRLPQADLNHVLSLYERVTGRNLIRDSTISNVTGRFDLQTEPCTQAQLGQRLRALLLENLNIVIEPKPDGTWIARRGPL